MSVWDNTINIKNKDLIVDNSGVKIALFDKPGLVAIKADWCGYCKRLQPEYVKAAGQLKDNFSLYVVDGEEVGKQSDGITPKLNIRGFPTIKIVDKNGYIKDDYQSGRDADSIISFLTGKKQEPILNMEESIILKQNDLGLDNGVIKILKFQRPGLLMLKANWCGHCKNALPKFLEAAKTDKLSSYYILDQDDLNKLAPEIKKNLNIQGFPTFKLVSSDAKLGDEYNGQRTIESFIKGASSMSKMANMTTTKEQFNNLAHRHTYQCGQMCMKLVQEQFYVEDGKLYVDGASNGLLIIKDIENSTPTQLANVNTELNCYYINKQECPHLCQFLQTLPSFRYIKKSPIFMLISCDGQVIV